MVTMFGGLSPTMRMCWCASPPTPSARLRDIAETVGVTERTASQLVRDLEHAGYLTKTRTGRRNQYEVHDELPLRHPLHRHHTVGELIRFLQAPAGG